MSLFPSTGIVGVHPHAWLIHSGFKLGSSCFPGNPLPAELSPQIPSVLFSSPFNLPHLYTVLSTSRHASLCLLFQNSKKPQLVWCLCARFIPLKPSRDSGAVCSLPDLYLTLECLQSQGSLSSPGLRPLTAILHRLPRASPFPLVMLSFL